MKKLLILLLAVVIAMPAFSQEDKLKKLEDLENNAETPKSEEDNDHKWNESDDEDRDTVTVHVGDNGNEIFSVKEHGNETQIKIGKKEYHIYDDGDGVRIYKSYDGYSNKHRHSGFRGHLGGFEFGFNSFLSDFWSTTLAPEDNFMDLNTGKSYSWNFLLPCISIGFTDHFGLASTLGLAFNKYRFDNSNTIGKDDLGNVIPVFPGDGVEYSKSKLVTTYATLPIMLEVQIPLANPNRTVNIGAGVIGAAKLGSHTKVVYYTGGKQKQKNKDDFSLNAFRWGATGRIGYEFFQLYGTCYFTQMFEKGKGPELYPFEVGMAFTLDN